MTRSSDIRCMHSEIHELIPWWVNGRLSAAEAAQVESHLEQCAECRADVEVERRILAAVRHRTQVEYAPQASFQKLWTRIEEIEREVPSRAMSNVPETVQAGRTAIDSRWKLAAALVLCLGLGLLAAAWRQSTPVSEMPQYRTATASEPVASAPAQIRVVFSPEVTIDELTRIVRGNRLAIVEGPSESGVYGLAIVPGDQLSTADALARLRSDPRVRFAEPATAAGATTAR
jgi:anti-sigma-K factor RskA